MRLTFGWPTLVEWIVLAIVAFVVLAVIVPQFPIDFDAPPPRAGKVDQ